MSSARALLTDPQFNDVRATILDNNPGMEPDLAGRILEQALAFLATCGRYRTASISPSRVVDEGWHALILHTKLYADLCATLGGFVHHFPERPDPLRQTQQIIDRTTALITQAGYTIDAELWHIPTEELVSVAADCGHTPPGGCGPIGPNPSPGPMPKNPGQ
ncbi:hypothetical protein NLX86_06750 [Streptomyces sp. A3M-1-3]|uniref:glycine-rich domain-containing protein n=1 Tax=Streptomyces sp. A3M-1-3 TaxID=2962044 RepID=UPI0020B82F84|nr:hypothetical protein [Streptomyces sp. A3M-1-3]MCP3817846.1 hypothetical protein [Streptomyces sp. A3M-1-3]